MKSLFRTSVSVSGLLLLFACGGGGSSDSTPAAPPLPPPNAAPTAEITVSNTNPLFSDEVTLDGLSSTDSDGTIVNYRWVINGVEFTGDTVVINPLDGADLNVALTVEDDDGATASAQTTVDVIPNQPAQVTFTINNGFRVGRDLTFSITAEVIDNDSTIDSVAWDMGDSTVYGDNSTQEHIYTEIGEQIVTLTVLDVFGEQNTYITTIDVEENRPPRAVISGQTLGSAQNELAFSALQSSSLTGEIVGYEWDFGDGATSSGAEVSHTFNESGDYEVQVQVRDDFNVTATETINLLVAEEGQTPFIIDIQSDRSVIQIGQQIIFEPFIIAGRNAQITNYLWNLGDGSEVIETSEDKLTYIYSTPGNYEISVTARGADGFTSTATTQRSVNDALQTQSVSLNISTQNGVFMDGDVNIPFQTSSPNNTFNTAQRIPSQAIVVGFVTQSGTGVPGDVFEVETDELDAFLVTMNEGQRVLLSRDSEEDTVADLDLYLINSNFDTVDASISSSNTEIVTAPETGAYYVVPQAFEGGSTYQLVMDYRGSVQSSASLSADFVPGEMVGFSKEVVDTQSLAQMSSNGITKDKTSAPSMLTLLKSEQTEVLNSQSVSQATVNRTKSPISLLSNASISDINAAKLETLLDIKKMQKSGLFRSISPNYILKTQAVTNDQFNPFTWHYDAINLGSAWDITTGNDDEPVIVAVIDSGVLSDHPDLAPNLVPGYDFISDPFLAGDGDGRDPDPYDVGDSTGTEPNSYHGSHVGSTIAAATNNGIGIAGVGYNVRHMPLRALGRGRSGTFIDIYTAVLYAAGLPNPTGELPAKRADIINMSLGGNTFVQGAQDVINLAVANGVIVIAAAGNDSSSLPFYPAAYDNVISVSATDIENRIAYYSNFGATVDIAAPGGDVTVDKNQDGFPDGVLGAIKDDVNNQFSFDFEQGTSMASPHVAGVAALMKAIRPQLNHAEFELLLESGFLTRDIGQTGYDVLYGYGLLDAEKAVIAARDLDSLDFNTSRVNVSSSSVFLSSSNVTSQFTVNISGTSPPQISDISASGDFFTINNSNTQASGAGVYEVILNADLDAGTYIGSIVLTDSNNEQYTIVVEATVTAFATEQGGFIYALLIDAVLLETVDGVFAFGEVNGDGTLQLTINEVPTGEYYILIGTDIDYDNIICDGGELCGGFPTLNELRPIIVNDEDLSNLNVSLGTPSILEGVNESVQTSSVKTSIKRQLPLIQVQRPVEQ